MNIFEIGNGTVLSLRTVSNIYGLFFIITDKRTSISQKYISKQCLRVVYNNYTGCNRRNGPDFGRVFLMLNYTDITQNTYIQS